MARATYEDAKQFDNAGQFDVFNLENDQDAKRVQFLIDDDKDVLIYTYHGIMMKSARGVEYERKVSCLKTHKDDPVGTCPMCDADMKVKVARFIPLYSIEDNKPMLWERSGRFIETRIRGVLERMKRDRLNPLTTVVEVVREGKKGDMSTTYSIYPKESATPVETDDVETPDPEGSLLLVLNANEMVNYLQDGSLPSSNSSSSNDSATPRQRTASRPAAAAPASRPRAEAKVNAEFAESSDEVDPEDFF